MEVGHSCIRGESVCKGTMVLLEVPSSTLRSASGPFEGTVSVTNAFTVTRYLTCDKCNVFGGEYDINGDQCPYLTVRDVLHLKSVVSQFARPDARTHLESLLASFAEGQDAKYLIHRLDNTIRELMNDRSHLSDLCQNLQVSFEVELTKRMEQYKEDYTEAKYTKPKGKLARRIKVRK